jgi:uncharacterized SAM-binding protein YcdF (DUF218 family)
VTDLRTTQEGVQVLYSRWLYAIPQSGTTKRILSRLFFVAFGFWLLGACIIGFTGLTTHPQPADLVLVLGNTVDRDSRPLPRLEARLEAALTLYRGGGYRFIMVSGGMDPVDGRNEALGMRDWLVVRGVPIASVIMDSKGKNTRQSALHAQAWLSANGLHSVVVVSQYFHLPRARLALKQAGALDGGGYYPRRWFLRDVYSTLREVPGYLAYWMGWQ